MLKKPQLVAGHWYRCNDTFKSREVDEAQWTGTVFRYVRTKFGHRFWDEIDHPDDDRGFAIFTPVYEIPAPIQTPDSGYPDGTKTG